MRVTQLQMGMMVHITVWAEEAQAGRHACGVAFDRMRELNRIFSDYDAHSELRRFCAQAGSGPMEISRELMEVLTFAKRLSAQTQGAFDPTAAPLIRLWRKARLRGQLPEKEDIQNAKALVDWQSLILYPETGKAELRRAGMQLDLGAIAKGYMADECLKVLREQGYPMAMIEAGGDTVFGEAPPGYPGWPAEGLAPGEPDLDIQNAAISISGDSMQHLVVKNVVYSHVIDPRNGWALTNRVVSVVLGPCGMITDALATTGALMEEGDWQALLHDIAPTAQGRRFVDTKPVLPAVRESPKNPKGNEKQ